MLPYVLKLFLFFFFQNGHYNHGSGYASGPGSGSKLVQNPGSGSKFNVFGSTTINKENIKTV